jgi:endogenous inhibitor of DNA gyrase (YacG/DUF329 family)
MVYLNNPYGVLAKCRWCKDEFDPSDGNTYFELFCSKDCLDYALHASIIRRLSDDDDVGPWIVDFMVNLPDMQDKLREKIRNGELTVPCPSKLLDGKCGVCVAWSKEGTIVPWCKTSVYRMELNKESLSTNIGNNLIRKKREW